MERLEELITDSYSPNLYKGKPFTENELPDWSENITKEIKNVTTYLRHRAYNITNERSFEILIHQYQGVIIDLLDKVYAYEKEADSLVLCAAYHMIGEQLSGLLSFITKTFSLYFNNNEKVPKIYLHLSKEELKATLIELEIKLIGKPIDDNIIKIGLAPIRNFIKYSSKEISYAKLLYIKELCKQLVDFSLATPNPRIEANKELSELLVYMNLNSSEFINYLVHTIINAINSLDEQALKIEKLTFYLKDFKQIQEKPGVAFNSAALTVKEQVTEWIKEEIVYYETKSRLVSVMPALKNDESILDSEKLIVSVSVEVLAILARAGKDSKFILNKHMTEMYNSISKFCRTVKAESPTGNSLRKKGYVAARSNKAIAIDILHEMIKHIHKY